MMMNLLRRQGLHSLPQLLQSTLTGGGAYVFRAGDMRLRKS